MPLYYIVAIPELNIYIMKINLSRLISTHIYSLNWSEVWCGERVFCGKIHFHSTPYHMLVVMAFKFSCVCCLLLLLVAAIPSRSQLLTPSKFILTHPNTE